MNCSSCHTREDAEGTRTNGPPALGEAANGARALVSRENMAAAPFRLRETLPEQMYRAFTVPWVQDDIHQSFKTMTPQEAGALIANLKVTKGVIIRWNGSVFYPANIPDLIGVKNRKYLDHTGTHLNRGVGDIMRYAALVSYAETADFGSYHMVTPEQGKLKGRVSDEPLYGLAVYIESLEPPPNPTPFDAWARAGQQVFMRSACPACHTPGLYTNNKLTLATGFTIPADKPATLDVLPISVGTDANLALKTRKG